MALLAPGALPLQDGLSLDQSIQNSYAVIAELQQLIQAHGLEAEFYGTLNPKASYHTYYAASTTERADAFEKALVDPSVKAIFILRGGFGSMELVALWETQKRNPFLTASHKKPLVGYSDATYLLHLAQQNDFGVLHGPGGMTYQELTRNAATESNASLKEIIQLLTGQQPSVMSTWTSLTPHLTSQPSLIIGMVAGGNLSVLQRNAGTPTTFQGEGKFVFFEDTERDPKRQLDLFIHLIRTQAFGTPQKPAQAILLGYTPLHSTLKGTQDLLTETATVYEAWLQRYQLTIPLFYNPNFGHGITNHVLPLGTHATLRIDRKDSAQLDVAVNQAP